MYVQYKNRICVELRWLIERNIISLTSYKYHKRASNLIVANRACKGQGALIEFDSINIQDLKSAIIKELGDPYTNSLNQILENSIDHNEEAFEYFASFKLPDGRNLPEENQREYYANVIILDAIDKIINNYKQTQRLNKSVSLMDTWATLSNSVEEFQSNKYPHSLPKNHRSLQRKLKKYKAEGFLSIVHKGFGNGNNTKITKEIGDFILAVYCLPNKPTIPVVHQMYKAEAKKQKWASISESAIAVFLDKTENKRIWTIARHGKAVYSNQFQHHVKRDRSNWFPNSYWAIDGTKLDWIHYEDNTIKMAAKLKINPVVDVFSEAIIGWSFSETENHVDHFTALKMAFDTSGAKPYLFTYDNQSGHKSKRMQDLYNKVVASKGTHYPHRARSSSNPIEQIFNRFQQQVLNTMWFSDGQTIKARNLDNLPNMDFIQDQKHKLKNKEKLEKVFEYCVNKWNAMEHPKFPGMSRIEAYTTIEPAMEEKVSFLDIIGMFWISSNESTYKRGGIAIDVARERYEFEVYDQNDQIDLEFRKKYVGQKFIVKYDPDALDSYVRLYRKLANGSLEFVANAQPKRAHESIPALMEEGDKENWLKDYEVRNQEYQRDLKEYQELMKRTGITPEKLIEDQELMFKLGGDAKKEDRSKAEAQGFLTQL